MDSHDGSGRDVNPQTVSQGLARLLANRRTTNAKPGRVTPTLPAGIDEMGSVPAASITGAIPWDPSWGRIPVIRETTNPLPEA